VLASIPSAPTNAPTSDISLSSDTQLRINYDAVSENGGSPLLSYSLEISKGEGGPFTTLYGDLVDTMILAFTNKPVDRGVIYRARYRCRNVIGWSDYSPVGFLFAAKVPAQPIAPVYYSATDSTISVVLEKVSDNGGSLITSHELWIDDGARGSFSQVSSYDQGFSFVIDSATETSL
jgi:hypothetical protein